ncbi:hypothetical protein C8R47DRAFT_1225309 [Mycena vitilis]|nr:hypothetical protein C8R47DRAFT_1225309 [Mycena vitilis]
MEWSLLPDWHHHDRDYRAWMPVSRQPRFDDPWFLQTKQEGILVTSAFDTYIIAESWRGRMIEDLQRANTAVKDISCRPPFTGFHPRPPSFDVEALYKGRISEKEARALVASARRNMLENLGFLAWRKATCSRWSQEVTKDTVELIEGLALERFAKRGVLINLARDWKEISLHMLLKHEVPVLYPWTVREEIDARFACLAPSILSAFREKCVAAGGQGRTQFSDKIAESATFKKLFLYTLFMDNPGANYSRPKNAPTTISKQASVRIVDFPGWGSRDVTTKKLKNRYHSLYYFGTFGKVVVFWRHSPIASEASRSYNADDGSDDDEDEREDGAVDDTEELMFVREQYKGSCAPRPGQTFDPETGFQRDKPYFGASALERFTGDLNRAIPTSSGSQAFRSAREAVEEVARMIREDRTVAMDVDSEERAHPDDASGVLQFPPAAPSQLPADKIVAPPTSSSQFSLGTETPSKFGLSAPSPPATLESSQLSATNPSVVEGGRGKPSLLNRLSTPGGFPLPVLHPPPVLPSPSLMARLSKAPPTAPRAERDRDRSHLMSRSSASNRRSASPPPHRTELPQGRSALEEDTDARRLSKGNG